jgi:hypothetical protein
MLTVARPLTAPDPVGDMIDSLVYDMTKDGGAAASGVTSVELTVETSAESDTPVGDSIAATSQQQLNPAGDG